MHTDAVLRKGIPAAARDSAREYIAAASGSESGNGRDAPTQLRLLGEFGVEIPLWDDSRPLTTDPAYLTGDLGLDAELVVDLIAWGYLFDQHMNPQTYRAIGRALAHALQDSLSTQCRIVYHP